MERVYFVKASKEELKFAAEAIEILTSQEVKLNMRCFLKGIDLRETNGLLPDEVNVCNTSCCIAGAHAIHFNKKCIPGGSYSGYLARVGIVKDGYFERFILCSSWPKYDVMHAIGRLRIIKESGFIPCIGLVDASIRNLDRYNPTDREWYDMQSQYHEGNILPLLEAKIYLLKIRKNRNKLPNTNIGGITYFGVDI